MIIGICGGSASGKTTFAKKIHNQVESGYVTYMRHDAYYLDMRHCSFDFRQRVNFDHPEALDNSLFIEHLKQLKASQPIEQPIYDFTTHTRLDETKSISPHPIILVEGILIYAIEELRKLLDIKVFVDTDDDIRLARRTMRDMQERGRSTESIITQYLDTVRPMHNKYVYPYKQFADLIISGNSQNYVGMDLIVTKIKAKIRELKKLEKNKQ